VKTVFRNADVGYGSAMAVLLTLVIVAIGLAYARISTRRQAVAAGPGRLSVGS
jgi:ABC-type sugar transport system permease subunit